MTRRLGLPAFALLVAFGAGADALAQGNPQSSPGDASGRTALHPAAPHFDGPTGAGQEVHRPVPTPGAADARQAPHLDNTTDGPTPHQTGPEPRNTAAGPAPHLDNTTDGPTPHTGRH